MKNQIKEVFSGNKPGITPVSVRFDLWLNYVRETGAEPKVLRGLSYAEAEDYLGFQRTARFRGSPKIDFGAYNPKIAKNDNQIVELYNYKGHVLQRKTQCDSYGLKGHITEYPGLCYRKSRRISDILN